MGNRAVIATEARDIGIYLHWNGGRDSVEGFLTYCKILGHRPPETDDYGWARLCQVISNFMQGTLSVGIGLYDQLDTDNYDNGVYIIKDWKIIDREYMRSAEQHEYRLLDFLHEVDAAQPGDSEHKADIEEYVKREELR